MKAKWIGIIAAAGLLTACAESSELSDAPVVEDAPSVDSDLAPIRGSKDDTGYLSNLAAEIDAVFTSRVSVDLSELSTSERTERVDELLADQYKLADIADAQIKFAKRQINSDLLHLNLSTSDMEVIDTNLRADGILDINYEAHVETIITNAELDESGQTIDDVLALVLRATLPSLPGRMAETVKSACLEDGHEDAEEYNYFYYFEQDKLGCEEAMESAGVERVNAKLELVNLAPTKTVYPEYHLLTEDGRIDVVVFFGAADYDWEPGDWDWGTYGRDTFVRHLSQRGFRKSAAEHGDLYSKTVGGLEERVTVVGPEVLKTLKNDDDNVFSKVVREHEIVVYNGHSFYGSLDVLDDPSIYTGKYQIFFMNSCWSYEYYTKQVFKNNVTANDPEGWLMADVVNDTESGWFHNMADETRILLTNLFAGAENEGKDEYGRTFDWEGIIEAMNRHALSVQDSRGTETHEIYGVSGVTTNRFTPDGIIEPPPSAENRFELDAPVAIPDNDPAGAVATIEIDSDVVIDSLTIDLAINHTYRGDLVVTLEKDGIVAMVFDGTTGDNPSAANVVISGQELDAFAGADAAGTWALKVVDTLEYDSGTISTLALTVN